MSGIDLIVDLIKMAALAAIFVAIMLHEIKQGEKYNWPI